jgi:hypothetical protein
MAFWSSVHARLPAYLVWVQSDGLHHGSLNKFPLTSLLPVRSSIPSQTPCSALHDKVWVQMYPELHMFALGGFPFTSKCPDNVSLPKALGLREHEGVRKYYVSSQYAYSHFHIGPPIGPTWRPISWLSRPRCQYTSSCTNHWTPAPSHC